MADKTAHLPPVSLAKEESAARLPAIRFVSVWALITSFGYALVYTLNRYDTVPCHPCAALTKPEVAWVDALWSGMMWFAAPQAAAAAVELLLLCRGRWMWIRRALAFVALASAFVSHCMYISAAVVVVLSVADDPGYLSFMIHVSVAIFVVTVGDLLGFLALLQVGDEE